MRPCWICALVIGASVAGCSSDPATQVVIKDPRDAGEVEPEAADDPVIDQESLEAQQEEVEAGPLAPAPVVVAVEPTAAAYEDGGTKESSQLDAFLLSMASGARGMTVSVRWKDLTGDGAETAWQQLEAVGALLRSQKRKLLLSIMTVEGEVDARPSGLKDWGSAATFAMHAMLDKLFLKERPELRYLSLGCEVDRYLSTHSEERSAFVSFAVEAMKYANAHPNRDPSLQAGITWSQSAWSSEANPETDTATKPLVEGSDVVMVSYAPIDEAMRAVPAERVTPDLAALLAGTGQRPVVLASVSYPSSSLIGGSEEEQARFLNLLFEQVSANRLRIPFVAVSALHDPAPENCLAKATAQGNEGSPELFAYWCSTGTRSRTGVPKQAYDAFRSGAAALLEP